MNRARGLFAVAAVLSFAGLTQAQVVPPFFFPGQTAFEPEIGIVQSGVVQDVQAVVSADRKYVTLNMQVQNAQLLALRPFTFQNGPALGVVGLPPSPAAQNGVRTSRGPSPSAAVTDPTNTSPDAIKRRADSWVLERRGMFRIASSD